MSVGGQVSPSSISTERQKGASPVTGSTIEKWSRWEPAGLSWRPVGRWHGSLGSISLGVSQVMLLGNGGQGIFSCDRDPGGDRVARDRAPMRHLRGARTPGPARGESAQPGRPAVTATRRRWPRRSPHASIDSATSCKRKLQLARPAPDFARLDLDSIPPARPALRRRRRVISALTAANTLRMG
jgi:hypothetical protein